MAHETWCDLPLRDLTEEAYGKHRDLEVWGKTDFHWNTLTLHGGAVISHVDQSDWDDKCLFAGSAA